MAGCAIGDPQDPNCFPPDPDGPPTPDEEANERTVNDFLRRVWSYQWTDQDEQSGSLPDPVSEAIDELVSPGYVRHRDQPSTGSGRGRGRDEDRGGDEGGGQDAFPECVRAIHNTTGNITVTILRSIAKVDQVTVLMTLEGKEAKQNGATEGPGLLGRPKASGRPYRAVVAAEYRLTADHKIAEDWVILDRPGLLQQLEGPAPSA